MARLRRHRPPIGDYTLVMRENYRIKDRILGERLCGYTGLYGGLSTEEKLVPPILEWPPAPGPAAGADQSARVIWLNWNCCDSVSQVRVAL